MDIDLETLEALLKEKEQNKNNQIKKDKERRRRYSESSLSQAQKNENNKKKSRKIEKFDPLKINFNENSELSYEMEKKKSFGYKDNEEEKTIMATNIPKYGSKQELYMFLKENNCGKIDKIRFVKDRETGKMSGRAFIQFYNSKDAKECLNISNRKFMGHSIKLVMALPRKNRDNREK